MPQIDLLTGFGAALTAWTAAILIWSGRRRWHASTTLITWAAGAFATLAVTAAIALC